MKVLELCELEKAPKPVAGRTLVPANVPLSAVVDSALLPNIDV